MNNHTVYTTASGDYKEVTGATRINAIRHNDPSNWSVWNAQGGLTVVASDEVDAFMLAEASKL